MKRVIIVLSLMIFSCNLVMAQSAKTRFTLDEAIKTALDNNLLVKQRTLDADVAEITYKQSKSNLLPNLNGNINHGINRGRSIDPFTNSYINQQVNYANYGLASDVVLFNGMSLRNTIHQARHAHDAAKLEAAQAADDLTLNVILAYLQVLSNQDILVVAENNVVVTQKQIDRLETLNREGAISPPLLYDLKGQLKENELAVVNSRNILESSKLALAQLMNIPYRKDLQLENIAVEESLTAPVYTQEQVYKSAQDILPGVEAANLRKKSAEAAVKVARGQRYPTVFLSGNYNTNYSSAAFREIFLNTSEEPTNSFVVINGNEVPVITKTNNFASEKISYGSQLKNNVFSGFGIGMRIPIFNGFQARNREKLAIIELKSQGIEEERVLTELNQQVELSLVNLNNAWERYKITQEQVAAYAESFRAAEIRFTSGVGTSVDYIIAKNNLDRANINLVMAKYEYLLRLRIVQFYNGENRK